ncbi:MAG: amino acid ABC transporter permease [Cyanobacteria bacterium]|nr:amino acid ABC transporter permease [Cyanobacteriota bacterium]
MPQPGLADTPSSLRPSPLRRLQRSLAPTVADGLLSLGLIALLLWVGLQLASWAIGRADWAVLQLNSMLLLVGRYPLAEQWRLWLLAGLLAVQAGLSWGLLRAWPRADRSLQGWLWPRHDRIAALCVGLLALLLPAALQLALPLQARWWLLAAALLALRWAAGRWGTRLHRHQLRLVGLLWPVLYLAGLWLIGGGLGLPRVASGDWGGLLLTLLLASFAMALSFPLGVLLALGRRSSLPLLRWGSVVYIEFIRGAPLITLLFIGQNILGFLLPSGLAPDRVWRAAWVLIFFAAAYLAEAVRSGLAAVPRGQLEAARSLGLSQAQALVQVVIPQALRVALPTMVGQFIALLQDTTLLSLIGLLDLLGTARGIMANPEFLGHSSELYLVLAVLYWGCCASLGLGSRALERRLDPRSEPTRG